MAYSKQGFVNGNVLDASQLIAMEDGILANETAINNIPAGPPGADGYSPVRGTDYWTETDIAEIKSYVDEAILGGAW